MGFIFPLPLPLLILASLRQCLPWFFLHIYVNIYWNMIFLSYHTSAIHEHDIYLTSTRLTQYWSRVNSFETTRLHLTFRWLKHNCEQLSFSQVNANIWFLVKFQSNMTFTWLWPYKHMNFHFYWGSLVHLATWWKVCVSHTPKYSNCAVN